MNTHNVVTMFNEHKHCHPICMVFAMNHVQLPHNFSKIMLQLKINFNVTWIFGMYHLSMATIQLQYD
jgi:hypothetical protein